MKAKGAFVSGGLHRIGGQIADANARRSGTAPASLEQQEPADEQDAAQELAPEPASAIPQQPASRTQEAEIALLQRHEELRRLKRDILARLAEQRASMKEELSLAALRSEALLELEGKCESLTESLAALPDPQPSANDYSRAVASAFRTAENARLELIMAQAKLEKLPGSSQKSSSASGSSRDSILPELNSLGRRQLLRFGLFLTAPIAVAIVLCGFIIALAIIAAMRLGI